MSKSSTQAMAPFLFSAGTEILYGADTIDRAGEYLGAYRCVLIVCGKTSARKHGHLDRLVAAIGSEAEVVLSETISPNPRLNEVEEAAAMGKKVGVDVVIGLGGGSVMDAAKAIAVAIGLGDKSITGLFRNEEPAPDSTLPIICIPTTAGTGSETSRGAILSDKEQGIKHGLRGNAILPKVAIVDPTLTLSSPRLVALETGFDVLTHAVETWASKKSSPVTALLSRHAIVAVARWLPVIAEEPESLEARSEMSLASTLMGVNLANSSTCLPHRMQYPVGALTDTSHPAGLAALYPSWCDATFSHAPEVFGFLAAAFGGSEPAGAGAALEAFLIKLGISRKLSGLGVEESQLPELVAAIKGSLAADPGDTSSEALLKIYQGAF